MAGILVGYARCFTAALNLAASATRSRRWTSTPSGSTSTKALAGTSRDRPGLREALAAVRAGDTLVVTKVDGLAPSIRDAHALVDELTGRGVRLQIGGSVLDPDDPVGRLLRNVLVMVAEFEADLIRTRTRTREGLAVAKARGRLRGRAPKLSAAQARHLVDVYAAGERTVGEIAELFWISRATVYRTLECAGAGRRLHGVDTAARPRILFQSVPEQIVPAFDELPGTHTFISGAEEVHRSDHDLLVTFEPTPLVDASWHVLGFGLSRVGGLKNYAVVELQRAENRARDVYVADNDTARDHRSLIERTILANLAPPPRPAWRANLRVSGFPVDAEGGNLRDTVVPLIHMGAEQAVYAFITVGQDRTFSWALPAETTGHREWLLFVLECLHNADPDRFPGEPDWQAGSSWATPELARAQQDLDAARDARQRAIAAADEQVAQAEKRVQVAREAAAAGPWQLLSAQSDDLVHAVQDALHALGFEAVELDEPHHKKYGRRLEDLRVTDPAAPEWESLVEVKGYTKGAKRNDVIQVTQAPITYFAAEHGRPPRTVWHVVNAQLGSDPSTRPTALPAAEDLAPLTNVGGALVDTRDLFRAWCAVQDGTATAESVRASLRTALTRWTWPSV